MYAWIIYCSSGMELSWKFRISHYLSKNRNDFEWLLKTLSEDQGCLNEKQQDFVKRAFKKHKHETEHMLHPECLISKLSRFMGTKDAETMIMGMFESLKTDAVTSHKDYNVACPLELKIQGELDYIDEKQALCHVFSMLSANELCRVKKLLSWRIVQREASIPYGTMELMSSYQLAEKVTNHFYGMHKCIVFTILILLDRKDLMPGLNIPEETHLVIWEK